MRSTGETRPRSRRNTIETERAVSTPAALPTPSFTVIPADAPSPRSHIQPPQVSQHSPQPKTRKRRGSLRKVALLGRGAQRERRETRGLSIDTNGYMTGPAGAPVENMGGEMPSGTPIPGPTLKENNKLPPSLGLGITQEFSAATHAHQTDGPAPEHATTSMGAAPTTQHPPVITAANSGPTICYTTTDDEDEPHRKPNGGSLTTSRAAAAAPSLSRSSSSTSLPLRPERASLSSGSDSFVLTHPITQSPSRPGAGGAPPPRGSPTVHHRRRTSTHQRAKSPLATIVSTPGGPMVDMVTAAASADAGPGWDYGETEWWGWMILLATWAVFVVGMGSCLGVWSWAWDVGTTPYAPPELEDDPTLPIVGYYPALMILTGVMAWVWVVVAWVGMKYFRHAQVGGD
ncbi:hypothetical protein VTK26DRAFT_8660 [Humicola hyalothermophila]